MEQKKEINLKTFDFKFFQVWIPKGLRLGHLREHEFH
jgi:hypothetical protein